MKNYEQSVIPLDWQTMQINEYYDDFTVPFYDAIDLKPLERYFEEGNYIVVFESTRKLGAVDGPPAQLLEEADQAAMQELQTAPGFKFYFRGVLTPERRCRAFCIWDNVETAKTSAQLPKHQEAVQLTSRFYETYDVKGFTVQRQSPEDISFIPTPVR